MVIFTIHLQVMSAVGAQRNETIIGWHEIQRNELTPVKTNGCKTITSLRKLVISHQPAELSTTVAFRNILKLF